MSGIFVTSAITLAFISLILGNIVPVYSIGTQAKHGSHISIQNPLNSDIEKYGLSVNNLSKSYTEQIITSCYDNDDHCPRMALDELNKTTGVQTVLGTFSDLIRLYDENNYSCHHEGHHLGMRLYDYTSNLEEALNHATILCGGSVYHGIFQSFFGGEQFVHNTDKNQIVITQLCTMGQENVT